MSTGPLVDSNLGLMVIVDLRIAIGRIRNCEKGSVDFNAPNPNLLKSVKGYSSRKFFGFLLLLCSNVPLVQIGVAFCGVLSELCCYTV